MLINDKHKGSETVTEIVNVEQISKEKVWQNVL